MALSKIEKKIKETNLSRMSWLKPSNTIIILLLISISILILGGSIYDIMLRPSVTIGNSFIYPGMSDQTMTESVSFMFLLVIGVTGEYITYQSSRHAYRPREARMYLLIGLVLLVFAFIGCTALLRSKGL
jgi:cation transport ATPase